MLILPKNYKSSLNVVDTQAAIKYCKDNFELKLSDELNLIRVSAPLYVLKSSGLNDHLNGVERPVSFDIKDIDGVVEIVQSLAKWKRWALNEYEFEVHHGLYTDMNAIRRDENLDNIHSNYVDQWDYEIRINVEDRNVDYLKDTVRKITRALYETQTLLHEKYGTKEYFQKETYFITSEELLQRYPNLDAKQREYEICKEKRQVFIIGIGEKLSNGEKHDNRAFDYDDWTMNGDLLVFYDLLDIAVEVSSMGIRVDADKLLDQARKANIQERQLKSYHNQVLYNELPLTLGGGIGQSRMCMVMLNKAHIGEVQASLWPAIMVDKCLEKNIKLL